jgi:hypothetical protein
LRHFQQLGRDIVEAVVWPMRDAEKRSNNKCERQYRRARGDEIFGGGSRINLEDGERMAAIFAQHHCESRQAGPFHAAWRYGSASIRKRVLDAPDLFFKTQRQTEVKPKRRPARSCFAIWRWWWRL